MQNSLSVNVAKLPLFSALFVIFQISGTHLHVNVPGLTHVKMLISSTITSFVNLRTTVSP